MKFEQTEAPMVAWHKVLLKDPCVYCGGPANSLDHIVPRSRGGTSKHGNLAPACVPCNMEKSSQPLVVYLLRKERRRRRLLKSRYFMGEAERIQRNLTIKRLRALNAKQPNSHFGVALAAAVAGLRIREETCS